MPPSDQGERLPCDYHGARNEAGVGLTETGVGAGGTPDGVTSRTLGARMNVTCFCGKPKLYVWAKHPKQTMCALEC